MDGSQTDEKYDCNNEAEEVDNEDEVTFFLQSTHCAKC